MVRERVGPWTAASYLRLAQVNRGYARLSAAARYTLRVGAVRAGEHGRVCWHPARRSPVTHWIAELVVAGFLAVRRTSRGARFVELRLPRHEPYLPLQDRPRYRDRRVRGAEPRERLED